MRIVTAWPALDQQPLRFLATSWPWRSLVFLLTGALLGVGLVGVVGIGTSGPTGPWIYLTESDTIYRSSRMDSG